MKPYKNDVVKFCVSLTLFLISFVPTLNNKPKQLNASEKSPSKITIVTDSNRAAVYKTKLYSGNETYNPKDRQFAHCASCCQTGNRLWVAWNTGGFDEPNSDMYAVLAYSDDFGVTWTDPAIIIDYQGYTDYTPYLFVDDMDRFWVTWNYNGTYALTISNPEASMDKIRYTEMGKILPRSCSSTPIILSDGTYLACMEGTMPFYYLYESTDKGATWKERSCLESKASRKYWNEGHVVELSNGDIIYESRIEVGDGYELYTSHDKGFTWDKPEYYRGRPFVSCGVKCGFIKLSNGNFVFASNDSTTKREKMTIYISKDDCQTWSQGLLLDEGYSEYPTITEMADGRVFVVWTHERLKIGEIRCAILSLDDIENCELSSNSKNMMVASRAHQEYKDVKKINLNSSYTVEPGLSIEEVVAKLPQYVKITGDDKGIYSLEVSDYQCSDYQPVEGTYTFKIIIDDDTFQDVFNILKVDVIVQEKQSEQTSTQTSEQKSSENNSVEQTSTPETKPGEKEEKGCSGSAKSSILLALITLLAFLFARRKYGHHNVKS